MPTLMAADEQVGGFPAQASVNLDRGYDRDKTRWALGELDFTDEIARKASPPRIQAGHEVGGVEPMHG